MVAVPVLVPATFNLPATAPLWTATTITIVSDYPSTSVPADTSTPIDPVPVLTTNNTTVAPVLLLTTTTVPANNPTIVAPAPEPTITTTFPSNLPTPVVPEPDTITTTCVYDNPYTQNAPVPDPNPPPTPFGPVHDKPSATTSDPTVVADVHGVKWYNSKDVIYLDEVPSLQ